MTDALAHFQNVFDRWQPFTGDLLDLSDCVSSFVNEMQAAPDVKAFGLSFLDQVVEYFQQRDTRFRLLKLIKL